MSSIPYCPTWPREIISSFLDTGSRKAVKHVCSTLAQKIIAPRPKPAIQCEDTSQGRYLNWNQRPEGLVSTIDSAFKDIEPYGYSTWHAYNGCNGYSLCGVRSEKLLTTLIKEAPPGQQDFYYVEIGAGNFQNGAFLAEKVDEMDLDDAITVHIISVRGERNTEPEIRSTKRCKVYNFGSFKVEELEKEFQKRGLYLRDQVDMLESSWCFRHLADPPGTFDQAFNLLRPKRGHMLMDSFFFTMQKDLSNWSWFLWGGANQNMITLLRDTQAPFLMEYYDGGRSLNRFILRRPDATPCKLPMSYESTRYCDKRDMQVGSSNITQLKRVGEEQSEALLPNNDDLFGDRNLYNWLRGHRLVNRKWGWNVGSYVKWSPIERVHEVGKKDLPRLHAHVLTDSPEPFAQRLKDLIAHINDSDYEGMTPLCLAARLQKRDICTLLLDNRADVLLPDFKGHTPLHQAAMHDETGECTALLLKAGACVKDLDRSESTPLDLALKHKKVQSARHLLEQGAPVSDNNRDSLRDTAFNSLKKWRMQAPNFTGNGIANIFKFIKQGECLVLHHAGKSGHIYHQCNPNKSMPSLEDLRVIYVDLPSYLLAEDELPSYLTDDLCKCPLAGRVTQLEGIPFCYQVKINSLR